MNALSYSSPRRTYLRPLNDRDERQPDSNRRACADSHKDWDEEFQV